MILSTSSVNHDVGIYVPSVLGGCRCQRGHQAEQVQPNLFLEGCGVHNESIVTLLMSANAWTGRPAWLICRKWAAE